MGGSFWHGGEGARGVERHRRRRCARRRRGRRRRRARARGRPQGVSDEAAHAALLAPDHAGARPAERPRRARLTAVLPYEVLGLGPADGRRGRPPRRQRGDAAPGELSQPVHKLPVLRECDGRRCAATFSGCIRRGDASSSTSPRRSSHELGDRAALFRELGTEIVTAADTLNHRRGSSYLQEQLSNYAAAWCTHSVKRRAAAAPTSRSRTRRSSSTVRRAGATTTSKACAGSSAT